MKQFAKVVLIISAVMLAAGIVLASVGVMNGAKLNYSKMDARQLTRGTVFYQIFD